ncbi:anaerobic C4-dicarboxylate transporter [Campylobacter jejuni]|uniref:anaerobic C4-dicarboxylate transporter n=1 Tax=Campylobacter jejuni TaxID=197 RepID=UPI0012C7A580|nr:anaerobic C4-dicarboxylate transporter [Campylobacter jejuni]EAK6723258.1 anaerobic C4-dicarboxylate transporter [Campylobacter jejuni]EEY4870776.1 anaerobic C4-dicarboxylate transporter [Campylobacter jejuni]
MDFLTSLSEGGQFAIQIIIVLICLFYGAKKGGIALGLLGGIGILMLVFAFHIKPGKPAIDVMLTILAVVVASATLQASGGLDVMLQIAERILRRNPISVAVVSLTALLLNANHKLAGFDGYINLLQITIPSTLFGVLCIGIFSWFRGKDLDKDEVFQEKLKDPEFKKYVYGDSKTLLGVKLPKSNWVAMWIFLGAIALVALLGVFDFLRPNWGQVVKNGIPQVDALGNPKMDVLSMVSVIQMFMLLAGSLIIIFTKTDAKKIGSNEIFKSGMIALVAVFGISWMADTMFAVHTPMMKAALGDIVKEHPWTYAVMLLLISKFVNSQAAAISAFVPLALGIGVEPGVIVAFAAACYGYYILPTYPSDLATIQFDRSGTTHIGKFVINHSFILPGLIGVITSCIAGYFIAMAAGYL